MAFEPNVTVDQYRSAVTRLHRICTTRLYLALGECALNVPEPQGAFYFYPSFSPYSKQLEHLGIKTSVELAKWLIEECGIAALPGSAFGEDDAGSEGGRHRLRMATSYLYFQDSHGRFTYVYELLEDNEGSLGEDIRLPLLDEAIDAIKSATNKLSAIQV